MEWWCNVNNDLDWHIDKDEIEGRRSGDVKLRAKQEVFPNCTAAIVEVLMSCFLEGQPEVSTGQIISSVGVTGKTVDNCLSKAVKAKHPEICRSNRGRYKLAPRIQEGLKSVRVDREEVSEKPLSDCVVSTSRQVPDGKSGNSEFFPREVVGKSSGSHQTAVTAMDLVQFLPDRVNSLMWRCLLRAARLSSWCLLAPATTWRLTDGPATP